MALLTGQLAQKTEEIETVTADNARLRAQVAELAKPRQHSSYLNISAKQMQEMDPSDRMTNLRLKLQMLALAMDVSAACPGTVHTDYIVRGADLDAMEISDQNKSLTEQISFLQARLQKLQAMPCDSFATPAPSALQTPASAAPTAAGLKRGRGEESSSPRPRVRPAVSAAARAAGQQRGREDESSSPGPRARPPVSAAPAPGQQRWREDAGWKTEGEARPRGRGRLILNGEGLNDTTPITLDGNGKIQTRDVARYCRHAAVEWIKSKAADINFQPTGEPDLVPDVCRHLIDTIPVSILQKPNAYTQPGRFAQAVLKREAVWRLFQSFRSAAVKSDAAAEVSSPAAAVSAPPPAALPLVACAAAAAAAGAAPPAETAAAADVSSVRAANVDAYVAAAAAAAAAPPAAPPVVAGAAAAPPAAPPVEHPAGKLARWLAAAPAGTAADEQVDITGLGGLQAGVEGGLPAVVQAREDVQLDPNMVPPAAARELSVSNLCSELTKLGVRLDPRVALLARRSDLFGRLDDKTQWTSDADWELAFPRGLSISLFIFGCISEEQQKQMELDSKVPVFSVPTDSELSARRKQLILLLHPDHGAQRFCQANGISNLSDWIQALKPTFDKAFHAFDMAVRLLRHWLIEQRGSGSMAPSDEGNGDIVPTLSIAYPAPVAPGAAGDEQVDITALPDPPPREVFSKCNRPLLSQHNPFLHLLSGERIECQFESLMELVHTSLSTVFQDGDLSRSRQKLVCDCLIDIILNEHGPWEEDGLLSVKVLETLKHGAGMSSCILDWFLHGLCDACGVLCATEDSPIIEYTERASDPFGTTAKKLSVVVWGVHLLEKICQCYTQQEMDDLIRRKWIQDRFKDRELGLFIQGDTVHYTTGAMYLPAQAEAENAVPSVSWRCSMNWRPAESTRAKCNRFVHALRNHDPLWHISKVALQRPMECAARSLLDLSDLLFNFISRGAEARDTHHLPRDSLTGKDLRAASRKLNDDAYALRTFNTLNLFKSLGSAGLFDFGKCLAKAITLHPAAAHSILRRRRSAAADAGVGRGEEDTDLIIEFLEYIPAGMRNGSIIASLSNVPGGSRYNQSPHGKISGGVTLQVGNDSHQIKWVRNLHATLKNNSCGWIFVGQSAVIAVSDTLFMGPFEILAPRAAECLRSIADCFRDDDKQCGRLREHLCCSMLLDVSDSCSLYWPGDPDEACLLAARNVAGRAGIVWPEAPTRGQKWALAILSPEVQFQDGYCKFLVQHLDQRVGFTCVQRRIWKEAAIMAGKRRRTRSICPAPEEDESARYGHVSFLDCIPQGAVAIWPMVQLVDDGCEHGFGNHFEVMTCEDPAKSPILLLSRQSVGGPQDPGIQVPDSGRRDCCNRRGLQTNIRDFFPPGQPPEHSERANSAQNEQNQIERAISDRSNAQDEQNQIDQIKQCLQRGRNDSRAADRAIRIFFQKPGCNEACKVESLASIIRSLSEPRADSLEDVQRRVARYVETVIFVASAVAADSMDKLKPPIQAVLWWVLRTIIPGSTAKIASKKTLEGWRESILPLLQNLDSSKPTRGDSGLGAADASHLSTLRNADPATSVATANQFAPECCFKCSSRSWVLGCSHVERDESVPDFVADSCQCRIGVCVECLGLTGEDVIPNLWYCRIHVSKGKDRNQKYGLTKCWECPASECPRGPSAGTEQPSELAQCVKCGIQLCPMHAYRTANPLKSKSSNFLCWVCKGRGPFTEMVRTQLRRLLNNFTNFGAARDLSRFTAQCVIKSMTQPQVHAMYDFANLVYDVYHSTLHEAAESFIAPLIEVNLHMSRAANTPGFRRSCGVPSTPSQLLRLLGGMDCPHIHNAPRILKAISEATAAEFVARNNTSSEVGARWARWHQPPEWPADGQLKMAVWLNFGGRVCPEVDLLAWVLTELEERKKGFSSIILCCRRLPGAKDDKSSYDRNYGPCHKLIEHFSKQSAIKWFREDDGTNLIHKWFLDNNFDAIGSVSGYSHGAICDVFAKEPRVSPLLFELVAYAGWMRGLVDYTWSNQALAHADDFGDPDRERALINENPYPALGFHNGLSQPSPGVVTKIQLPEPGRPVLLFSGSLDKLSKATVHMYCRILASTGSGPNSAVLAVMYSTDLGVDSVLLWIDEYNRTVGSSETVAASRLFIFPYRSKELFWSFLHAIRGFCLSISTLSHYDVHTTAGDALACCLNHLAMRSKNQMWQRNVAALLVEQVGLGQYLIATDEVDMIQKAVWWLLNPFMLQAASEHLARCQEEQVGYYNRMRMVEDLEVGIQLAFKEVVQAKGDRSKLRDIDLTEHKTRPPPYKEFTPPAIAPGLIVGESSAMQIDRLMNQITAKKLSFKGFDVLFQQAVCLHHSLGFRGMRIVGHGSSVLCMWAAYRGAPISGTVDHGQELALKVPHFTDRRPRQENRMANDSIIKAVHLADAAGTRRSPRLQRILPKPLGLYAQGCAAGFVQHQQCRISVNKPVRSRTVLCFGVFEYVQEGSLYDSALIKMVVSQYRKEGIISDKMSRAIQAIVFSVMAMNNRGCFNMDISWGNLAIREIDDILYAVWLDTGGSIVIPKQHQGGGGTPMMRCSTTVAAGPDVGQAEGLNTPSLSVNKKTGIGYLCSSKIRAMFDSGPISRTVCGTRTFRSEGMAAQFNDPMNKGKPLESTDASRFDFTSAMMCSVQLIRPAPRSSDARAQWERDLTTAIGSKEAMREFLQKGAEVAVQQPGLLDAYADMFWKSLRKEVRCTALDALVSKALSCKVWSLPQLQALRGAGISLPGGANRCPPGSPWHARGLVLSNLTLKEEFDSRSGASIGAGVLTPCSIKAGDFIGFYAGTEASEDEVPPCRYATYVLAGGTRRHVFAEQPVDWFLQRNIVGPFLNASTGNDPHEVELKRDDFWTGSDGILYIAMYATRDVAAGQFLRWRYNPFAGAGGRNSYMFPSD